MNPTTLRAPRSWNDTALARLEDVLSCPLCARRLDGQQCDWCGADFRGDIGAELWDASVAAADALRARDRILERVPVAPRRAPEAATPAPTVPVIPPRARRTSATVQSVLAVAGAGLVAIAAVVFSYFSPDLTDARARGLIVGAVTAVFVLGAGRLARRGLRFSAESVGALAVVFLGLDVHALTMILPAPPWAVAAVATTIAGGGIAALGLRVGIRTWVWAGMTSLAVVPAMLGHAVGAPVLGHFGVAVAAFGLLALTARFGRRIGATLTAERVTLTVIELAALVFALVQGWFFGLFPVEAPQWWLCAALASAAVIALFSTRHPAAGMWSFLAGLLGAAAFALLPLGITAGSTPWWMAVVPALAIAGAILVGVLLPVPGATRRGLLRAGVLTAVVLAVSPAVATAPLLGAVTALGETLPDTGLAAAVTWGLASVAAGLVAFSALEARLRPAPASTGTGWVGIVGLWTGGLAALTVLTVPTIALGGRVVIGLGLGILLSLALARLGRLRHAPLAWRLPLVVSAHALVVAAAALSWQHLELAVVVGPVVVVAVLVLALTVRAPHRFVHVAAAYAYALVVFATALSRAGVQDAVVLCLTTCLGAVVAIAATFLSSVSARSWYGILVVTSVPFLLGVGLVMVERSGWTALSTSLIFALALTLVVTRRAGLGSFLRAAAASILIPSLAVVVVCLGAQLLESSGSPVVLPIIAVIVALALAATDALAQRLAASIGAPQASLARVAVEASTLVTAAITVVLALAREAAGLPTAFVVLVILGGGFVVTALRGGRAYGWWLAAASFTGALWCAWGIVGVLAVEAYLLPPAIGAALVGAVLVGRGRPLAALYTSGLTVAVAPLVALVAVAGTSARAYALVVTAWALVVIGRMLSGRLLALRIPTYGVAIVAAAAGALQGVRFGLGIAPVAADVSAFAASVGIGVVAGAAAACAASGIAGAAIPASRLARTRWLFVPAFAYVAVAAWPAIERDWFVIWGMWALMLCLLASLVAASWQSLRGRTALPPVWVLFALAFVTAVVAWSPRDLRVEWFSLPLGAALLLAGALALGVTAPAHHRSFGAWPATWRGSWALLAPGIVVIMSASVAATFTDPQTWRAILVIVMALIAILVGASRRLAAPFLIGIVVLPVENAIAFLVQIGRGIDSMPWWITLAVVGAVLLIIAVTYERRAEGEAGIAARLRDLA